MRLIDADALRKYFEVSHELKSGIQAGMDEYALKCIDEQPTVEPASPWHRVDDGFPCENTDALFYDENGYFHVGIMSRFRWYTEFIDYDGNTLRGVTHWTPIEPPKEDA